MSNYRTFQRSENTTKRYSIVIDCSEYLFGISLTLSVVGLIINIIQLDEFDIFLSSLLLLMCSIAIWRVRVLGLAHQMMHSVQDMIKENDNLKQHNIELSHSILEIQKTDKSLRVENEKLSNRLNELRDLLGIFDKHNQTAEDLEQSLLDKLKQLKRENEKYTKLNNLHAFMISDIDKDGQLDENEQETIQHFIDIQVEDQNNDNVITKEDII